MKLPRRSGGTRTGRRSRPRHPAGVLLPAILAAGALLAAAPAAQAKGPLRCNQTRGTELAHSTVVKVYKVKSGGSYRFFGCAKPSGPVVALTQSFKGSAVKLVAAKGAYAASTRTIDGEDTIAVVDARTGKKRHRLYPPSPSSSTWTPRRRRSARPASTAAASSSSPTRSASTPSTTTTTSSSSTAARARSSSRSIGLDGETISWTRDSVKRTATIGEVPLSVTSGGGPTAGDVTTSPESGIACHVAGMSLVGTCIGSFAPGTGQATSVATCQVRMDRAKAVKVTFS